MNNNNFRDYDGEIIELFAEIEDDLWGEFQDEFIDRQIVYDNIIEKLDDMSNKQKEEIITRTRDKGEKVPDLAKDKSEEIATR